MLQLKKKWYLDLTVANIRECYSLVLLWIHIYHLFYFISLAFVMCVELIECLNHYRFKTVCISYVVIGSFTKLSLNRVSFWDHCDLNYKHYFFSILCTALV